MKPVTPSKYFLSTACTALLCAGGLITVVPTARAASKKRSIAVVEYRAGVKEAPRITDRLSGLLRKKTALNVLDPAEGRQRLGSGLDAAVADCGGQPGCVARVGRKLNVDEILLVGLTRLGDVIVALARIQTQTGRVLSRIGLTKPPGKKLSAGELFKALKQLLPAKDFVRYGTIRIRSNVAGAQIRIGGKDYGTTPLDKPLRVKAPKAYTIRLQRKGYMTFSADLKVPPDGDITVDAKLIPKGAGPQTPVYKKWWFWTAIGGTVVAAVAGTVVGVVLWQRSRSQPAEVTINW